jgi:hypothetical protein
MTIHRFTFPLAALALTATLSACSGDDEEPSAEKTPSASDSSSVDPSSVDPGNVSPGNLPKVPEVQGAQGAINALTLGDCETEAGKQTVTGEITSSAKKSADYLVTLSWTTSDSDVMGRGFAVLQDVAPGATEAFEIQAKVAKGATLCVPGVVYGTIAPG